MTPCATFNIGIRGLHTLSKPEPIELRIARGKYDFTSNETGHFNFMNGISFIGQADDTDRNPKPVTIKCSEGVGFSFINSSNISIKGIIFKGCSQLQNSTSYFKNSEVKFLQTYVSLISISIHRLYSLCTTISISIDRSELLSKHTLCGYTHTHLLCGCCYHYYQQLQLLLK